MTSHQVHIIVKGELLWRNIEGVLLKFFDEEQVVNILGEMHSGECGSHFMGEIIFHKVIMCRLWWSKFFMDAHELVKKCDSFEIFTCKRKFFGNLPLRPVEVQAPFQQCIIDFI